MRYAALALLFLSSTAMAQEAPQMPADTSSSSSAPSPQGATQNAPVATPAQQKFYFEVDQTDIQNISAALNELPKRIADPLILKLNAQLGLQAKIMADRGKALADPPKEKEKPMAQNEDPPKHHYRRHVQ